MRPPLDWRSVLAECGTTLLLHERWRPVKGFERFYAVSSHGRVVAFPGKRAQLGAKSRQQPGRVLSSSTVKRPKVHLYGDFDLHREAKVYVLVAEHFVPNPEGNPMVCHRDDNPHNNHRLNLYWGTYDDNAKDRMRNGGAAKKLTPETVQQMRQDIAGARRSGSRLAPGEVERIAAQYGVSTMTVHNIRNGKGWEHA